MLITELDHYFNRKVLQIKNDFDILSLSWWEVQASKYLIFQFITREDLLAILESTIVIESFFSTSSRMVSLDYKRLHSKN
jgi:hypothetical protein